MDASRPPASPSTRHGVKGGHYLDTRSALERFAGLLSQPSIYVITLGTLGGMSLLFPVLLFLTAPTAFVIWLLVRQSTRRQALPFRVPATAGVTDYSAPKPGTFRKQFSLSGGTRFLGNDRETREEIWETDTDIKTHKLYIGTTGSGKTVAMMGQVANLLLGCSGLTFVDPKGMRAKGTKPEQATPEVAVQIFRLARLFGRDCDFRILNFSTGNVTVEKHSPRRMSNTTNPFPVGSADSLTQIILSLIPQSGDNNKVFSDNAQTMMRGLMRALVELRDKGVIELSFATVNEYLGSDAYIELAEGKRHPELSEDGRSGMMNFLKKIGYKPPKDTGGGYAARRNPNQGKQTDELRRQFGFAAAYFGQPMSLPTQTFDYIYMQPIGEVSFVDAISRRRILAVTIPSMEKSPSEVEALGKIILSSVKNEINLITPGRPYGLLVDEYHSVSTPGFVEILAQARSFGIATVLGNQDFASLAHNEQEAFQITSNIRSLITLSLRDAQKTWQYIKAAAGEIEVASHERFEDGKRSADAQLKKMERIELSDLQGLENGEGYLIVNGDVSTIQCFPALDCDYAPGTIFPVHRLLQVRRPNLQALNARIGPLSEVVERMAAMAGSEDTPEVPAPPEGMRALLAPLKRMRKKPMEASIVALLNYQSGADKGLTMLGEDDALTDTDDEAGVDDEFGFEPDEDPVVAMRRRMSEKWGINPGRGVDSSPAEGAADRRPPPAEPPRVKDTVDLDWVDEQVNKLDLGSAADKVRAAKHDQAGAANGASDADGDGGDDELMDFIPDGLGEADGPPVSPDKAEAEADAASTEPERAEPASETPAQVAPRDRGNIDVADTPDSPESEAGEGDPKTVDEALSSSTQWLKDEVIDDTLASDLEKVEALAGADKEQARERSQDTLEAIEEGLDYPTKPTPEKPSQEEAAGILARFDDWVGELDERINRKE